MINGLEHTFENVLRLGQIESFFPKIDALSERGVIPKRSKQLNLFKDSENLIHMRGGITNSDLPFGSKHQIVPSVFSCKTHTLRSPDGGSSERSGGS